MCNLYNKDYDTDANHDLPQPLKRNTCAYEVTTVEETSFDPTGLQESEMHSLTSTQKGRPAESLLQQTTCRHLSFSDAPPHVVGPYDNDEEEEYFLMAPLAELV